MHKRIRKKMVKKKGLKKMSQKKTLSCRMEGEIVEAIETRAKEEDRPIAYIVRQAILQYLNTEGIKIEKPKEKSKYRIPDNIISEGEDV